MAPIQPSQQREDEEGGVSGADRWGWWALRRTLQQQL